MFFSDPQTERESDNPMFFKLLIAFTLIPVSEIYILVETGRHIGSLNTIMVVITTGFLGAYLAKIQGIHTMLRIRSGLEQGIMPTDELLDALLIFIAGIVLLTPGFITDGAGLLLLFPGSREYFRSWLKKQFIKWMENGTIHINRY